MSTTEKKTASAAAAESVSSGKPNIPNITPAPLAPWMVGEPTRPSLEWSLEDLGKFASENARKSAETAWELGRAFFLAKKKAKRKFLAWCKTYVPFFSERTIQRYLNVGVLDYDDVKGKGLDEIYRLLYGDDYATKKETTPKPTEAAPEPTPTDEAKPSEESQQEPEFDPQENALLNAIEVLNDLMDNPDEWKEYLGNYRDELKGVAERLLKFLAQ